MNVKCVIACHGGSGPLLLPVCVALVRGQVGYEYGDHYAGAIRFARGKGYSGAFIVFVENDGPEWLFGHYDWHGVETVVVD
jgi:hypothetical protein